MDELDNWYVCGLDQLNVLHLNLRFSVFGDESIAHKYGDRGGTQEESRERTRRSKRWRRTRGRRRRRMKTDRRNKPNGDHE